METEKKIEIAKYAISRFDEYYSGINSKGGFYLTLNTFIIGSVVTIFLSDKIILSQSNIFILTGLALLALAAIFLTLFSVNPFLSSGNTDKYSSMLFFGSIAAMRSEEFSEQFDNADKDVFYNDFKKQMYQLAFGLNRKFVILTWVGKLLVAEFLLITLLLMSLISN